MTERYFHGGVPGLEVGDLLVPGHHHFVDGCPVCAALQEGRPTPFDQPNQTPERVSITTDREYARHYASKYPQGDLYVVEPIGDLHASAEDHFPTWTVERARVTSVYARLVTLTPRQRLTLFRRWRRADREAELQRPQRA
jgi:hypothetical protein